jgi:hypothetical protein
MNCHKKQDSTLKMSFVNSLFRLNLVLYRAVHSSQRTSCSICTEWSPPRLSSFVFSYPIQNRNFLTPTRKTSFVNSPSQQILIIKNYHKFYPIKTSLTKKPPSLHTPIMKNVHHLLMRFSCPEQFKD